MAWIVKVGVEPSMTEEEMNNNAIEFYNFFGTRGAGYTLECISAILGNCYSESKVNPGCRETATFDGQQSGTGLVQWTPGTVLVDWCNLHGWDWFDGNAQCEKIAEELESPTGGQWYPAHGYNYTQEQFRQLTDIDEAVKAFIYEYLRPAQSSIETTLATRTARAYYYYQVLSGHTPIPPTPPTPQPTGRRKKMPLYMMLKRRLF